MSTTQPNDSDEISELTDEHFQFLRDAGASQAMLTFLKLDGRSRPKEKLLRKATRGEFRDPATFSHGGSHFFTNLWNGDMWQAWIRADGGNKRVMLEAFGEDQIKMGGLHAGEPADYVNRMVEEKL